MDRGLAVAEGLLGDWDADTPLDPEVKSELSVRAKIGE